MEEKAQWPYLWVIMWIPSSNVLLYLLWMVFRFTLNSFNIWHWGSTHHIREFMQKAQDDTSHLTLNFLIRGKLHILSAALASADFWLLSINAVLAFVLVAPPLSWFLILGQKYLFSPLQVKTQRSPNTLIQVEIKAQEIYRATSWRYVCFHAQWVFLLESWAALKLEGSRDNRRWLHHKELEAENLDRRLSKCSDDHALSNYTWKLIQGEIKGLDCTHTANCSIVFGKWLGAMEGILDRFRIHFEPYKATTS
jgi:hypothetical protein